MTVERSEVIRIAELAKLELESHEIERMTEDLNDILEYCQVLQQVDLSEEHRDDSPAASGPERRPGTLARDELAANLSEFAPSHEEGFFLVPRLPALDAANRDPGALTGEGP